MKVYAGIGSRQTPDEILYLMRNVAQELAYQGWTLRSGCAPGADSAFEDGAYHATLSNPRVPKAELYLPWPRFEKRRDWTVTLTHPSKEARECAALFHPQWNGLSDGAKSLHARNVHQILGADLGRIVPSKFVICWTKGGQGGGGTGQALRIAAAYGVPVFDLARSEDHERVLGLFRS